MRIELSPKKILVFRDAEFSGGYRQYTVYAIFVPDTLLYRITFWKQSVFDIFLLIFLSIHFLLIMQQFVI